MKVIVVDNSLAVTGAFKAVFQNISDKDIDVEWYYFIPEKSMNKLLLQQKNIKVYTFISFELTRNLKNIILYLPFLFWNGYKLSMICRKNKIDLIYQNEVFILCGLVARIWTKVRVLTHIRVMPTIFPKKMFRLWLYLHDKFATRIATVSFVCEKAAKKVYPIKQKVDVLYDFFIPQERLPDYKVKDCSHSATIVFIGNYTKGKGQDLALETVYLLHKTYANYKATIHFFGSDFNYPANIAYRLTLLNRIKEYGLESFAFLHEFTTEIETEMKQHDLLLNLSVAESFSFVVAEAMAYGIPIIATDSGGPGELIVNNETGLLVTYNAQELVTQAHSLLVDKARRSQFSLAGKARIKSLVKELGGESRFKRILTNK